MNRALLYSVLLLCAALGAGCGPAAEREQEAPPPPTPPTVEQAPEPPAKSPAEPAVEDQEPGGPRRVTGHVRVVDLEGRPLSAIQPIVTRQPNAFDEPVAVGPATGPDGRGRVHFQSDERLFLRAWDPELNWFPNNFLEIQPYVDEVPEVLTIVMVPAASLEAQFFGPDGSPLREVILELMLSHATWGAWWPARIQTDENGFGVFTNIPAGEYNLQFNAETGASLTMLEVPLRPAGAARLGRLRLE